MIAMAGPRPHVAMVRLVAVLFKHVRVCSPTEVGHKLVLRRIDADQCAGILDEPEVVDGNPIALLDLSGHTPLWGVVAYVQPL
jgi:hypothetical protein